MSELSVFIGGAFFVLATLIYSVFVRPQNEFTMTRDNVTVTFKSSEMPLDMIVKTVYMPLVEFSDENVRRWERYINENYESDTTDASTTVKPTSTGMFH